MDFYIFMGILIVLAAICLFLCINIFISKEDIERYKIEINKLETKVSDLNKYIRCIESYDSIIREMKKSN